MKTNLKREGIAHYNRMIKWAKKQPEKETPDSLKIYHAIDEDWYGDHCIYCNEHDSCNDCELYTIYANNTKYDCCCAGLWYKMDSTKTWKMWIKYAEKVKAYIQKNG